MDVACQHCPSVYPISEQKLAGRLVRFRCKSCGNAIVVDGRQNPSRPPAAVTSVPPLSLANIASSVAPQPAPPRNVPPLVGLGSSNPPAPAIPAFANVARPAVPGSSSVPAPILRAPALGRPSSAAPTPPPFPTGNGAGSIGINQSRAPLSKPPSPSAAVNSSPVVAPSRVAPSEPPPAFRAASQPHNPNPQEVDPSVYEDETVAMTAMELEAAADAQSLEPQSEPAIPQWSAPLLGNNPAATVMAAPVPPSLTAPPVAWNAVAHHANGFSASSAGLGSSVGGGSSAAFGNSASGFQTSIGDGAAAASNSNPPPFEFEPMSNVAPLRAESWSIGKNPAAPNPFTPPEWRPQPTPAPASSRTLASAEPPPQDNPWLFRGLLVVLGIGGVVLGGVLGNTWLRHLLPATAPSGSVNSQPAEFMNPHLPGFDALGANERLEAAQAEAVNCLNADTAPLTGLLVARFKPTGELDALTMTGSVGAAPETPCVRSVFDKVKVAPFSGVTSQVEKALELRPRP